MTPERRLTLLRILAFIFVVGIVVAIFVFRERVRELSHLGYLGAFLIPLIANATIFVPYPHLGDLCDGGSVQPIFSWRFSPGWGGCR